ncbi:unnamed protein product [Vicia faba]|uniref:ATP-dependent RNA helicase n=1 Tax=Vicia faba TaxID=3906 RepID=A0AAV0ZZW3_VICFA|nr:unnamed protein product [Vicia faba]
MTLFLTTIILAYGIYCCSGETVIESTQQSDSVVWIIQLSDLHFSVHHPNRAQDFTKLIKHQLVQPPLLYVSPIQSSNNSVTPSVLSLALTFSLQVLILDEADRILDSGFKRTLNEIISQLPKRRQTMLFSSTQMKSVQDLARLSLKDPEYLSVHRESVAATPSLLKQIVMIVPLDQKLDMLWTFIKTHLQFKTIVFLSSCKQILNLEPLFTVASLS